MIGGRMMEVLKGMPVYIVALLEMITKALPSLILWLTFIYAILQIVYLFSKMRHEKREMKKRRTETLENEI